jgi:hypothetical protein
MTIIRFAFAASGGRLAANGSPVAAGDPVGVAPSNSCIAIAPMPPAIEPRRWRRVASSLCSSRGSIGFLTGT